MKIFEKTFLTIPHAPRYEMNQQGVVRNRTTGKILKWTLNRGSTKQVTLCLDGGKRICATLPNLMWLLHGDIISKNRPIPTVIKKGTRSISFDSLKQCAFYLTKTTELSFSGIWYYLINRRKKVADWHIHYCY